MKEAGHGLVGSCETQLCLTVPERVCAGTQLMAIVTTQSGNVVGMDEPTNWNITLFVKMGCTNSDDALPFLASILGVVFPHQHAGTMENANHITEELLRRWFAWLQGCEQFTQLRFDPERRKTAGGRIAHPCDGVCAGILPAGKTGIGDIGEICFIQRFSWPDENAAGI